MDLGMDNKQITTKTWKGIGISRIEEALVLVDYNMVVIHQRDVNFQAKYNQINKVLINRAFQWIMLGKLHMVFLLHSIGLLKKKGINNKPLRLNLWTLQLMKFLSVIFVFLS